MRAVRFDRFGDADVLEIREVDRPRAGAGQAVVRVRASGINPGEENIREGHLEHMFPTTFPSGEGSDLAGIVEEVGDAVDDLAPGDEVLGWTDERAAHADFVAVAVNQLVPRPPNVAWEVAGSLFVAGSTAWAAVRAVNLRGGDTVVVSAAAGGVGSILVQLAARTGASVLGIAGESNHAWLREKGVTPVARGPQLADRLRAAAPEVDAFIDLFGDGYVELALELDVAPQRINTIVDFAAVERYGVKADGSAAGASREVIAELADLLAREELEVPIAATYPLDRVLDAYRDLAARHTRGKRVLIPS